MYERHTDDVPELYRLTRGWKRNSDRVVLNICNPSESEMMCSAVGVQVESVYMSFYLHCHDIVNHL